MTEALRVGFVPGVSPGKWLRTWAERLPAESLEARPVELEQQRELLLTGGLDMCFVRLPVDRAGLRVIPLYEEVPVVLAAKDHPVAAVDEVALGDLAGEHLLQDLAEVPEWAAVADEVREGTRIEPPAMTLGQAVEVAASGAGILVLPMSLARLHHRRDVCHRTVTGVAGSAIGLAWLVGNEDPRVETFIGIVRGRTARSSRGSVAGDGQDAAADGRTASGAKRARAAGGGRHGNGGGRSGGTRRAGSGRGRRRGGPRGR